MCLTHIILNSSLILDYNWAPSLIYLFKTMTHGESTRNTSLAPETVGLISTTVMYIQNVHLKLYLKFSDKLLSKRTGILKTFVSR